jgi:hypothetical protein
MAYQALGLGSTANDGTGDDLRTGGDKINDNFVEVYTALGTGSALTSGISADATTVTLTAPTINGVVGGTQTSATITALTTAGITGTGGALEITADNNIVEIRGDGASVEGQIKLNCHANSHGQTLKSQPHSANITNTMLLPIGASSTLVSLVSADTLTNKSIDLTNNTITGTTAEFNTALSDGSFATLAGTETLTNKSLTSPTITGTGAIAGTFTGNIDGIVGGTTPAAGSFTTASTSVHFQAAVHADTTARDAAITSPAAGMVAYLTATNKLQVYTGSAWETITSS